MNSSLRGWAGVDEDGPPLPLPTAKRTSAREPSPPPGGPPQCPPIRSTRRQRTLSNQRSPDDDAGLPGTYTLPTLAALESLPGTPEGSQHEGAILAVRGSAPSTPATPPAIRLPEVRPQKYQDQIHTVVWKVGVGDCLPTCACGWVGGGRVGQHECIHASVCVSHMLTHSHTYSHMLPTPRKPHQVARRFGFQAFNPQPQAQAAQAKMFGGGQDTTHTVYVPATLFVASDHLVGLLLNGAYSRITATATDEERFARAVWEVRDATTRMPQPASHASCYSPHAERGGVQVT